MHQPLLLVYNYSRNARQRWLLPDAYRTDPSSPPIPGGFEEIWPGCPQYIIGQKSKRISALGEPMMEFFGQGDMVVGPTRGADTPRRTAEPVSLCFELSSRWRLRLPQYPKGRCSALHGSWAGRPMCCRCSGDNNGSAGGPSWKFSCRLPARWC